MNSEINKITGALNLIQLVH